MILSLALDNETLYRGLDIATEAGRLNLRTAPEQAIATMIVNLQNMPIDPEEVILTGSMAIWAYLAVFHFLHGRTRRIYYEDGRGDRFLVAAHG
ncbi:MAG TPA: hypothetical protein VI670_07660 [Thermoanaerobaculia bacterium]